MGSNSKVPFIKFLKLEAHLDLKLLNSYNGYCGEEAIGSGYALIVVIVKQNSISFSILPH